MLGAVDVLGRAQQHGHDFASVVELHSYALTLELAHFLELRDHLSPFSRSSMKAV
jgi:hypothetical protein